MVRRPGTVGRAIGVAIVGTLWLIALAVAGASGVELLLRLRTRHEAAAAASRPRFDRLVRAYQASGVQHLHPQYLFFFPFNPAERVAISNPICSIDPDGFRGPGPASAGGRQLAFLLGGSTAFGYMAGSDAATITGYLNLRTAFQLLDYHPALVVTLDGANDARLLGVGHKGVAYQVGTPESFDDFQAAIERPASRGGMRAAVALLGASLFPAITQHFTDDPAARSSGVTPTDAAPTEDLLRAGAARYLANLARMKDLANAHGARFVAAFQPAASLHRHLDRGPAPVESFAEVEGFHRAVLAQYAPDFEFHDLGNVFDNDYAVVPVMQTDITDETIFIDAVHLTDRGNEIVVRHLSGLLQ